MPQEHTLGRGFFEITNYVDTFNWWDKTEGTAVLLIDRRRSRTPVPLRTEPVAPSRGGELLARVTDDTAVPPGKAGVLGIGQEAVIAAGYLRAERRLVYEGVGAADTVLVWDEAHPQGFMLEGFQAFLDCRIDLVWRETSTSPRRG